MEAFKYNPQKKHYQFSGVYSRKKNINLTGLNIFWNNKGDHFPIKFPDIFEKYIVTISNENDVDNWKHNPMQFWQIQLHFAIWCATSGCGVSFENHLSAFNGLTKSLFYFHVYYQIRRILEEMEVPLPQDNSWNMTNNNYNKMAYEKICKEFGISTDIPWQTAHGPNRGMGQIYTYDKRYPKDKRFSEYKGIYNPRKVTFDHVPDEKWIPNHNIFSNDYGHWKKPDKKQIKYIKQLNPYWKTFILDKSEGFTRPGVVRINDSIRTYVWALLGAQVQIRSSIDTPGTAFEVQKQFLANVEDRISSPVDLPASIKRYQDVLEDASSKLDYVFGIDLYMAPSNMKLRIDATKGYNNRIMIADSHRVLGKNPEINKEKVNGVSPSESNGILAPKGFTPPKTLDLVKKEIPREKIKRDDFKIAKFNRVKVVIIIGGILCGLYVLEK